MKRLFPEILSGVLLYTCLYLSANVASSLAQQEKPQLPISVTSEMKHLRAVGNSPRHETRKDDNQSLDSFNCFWGGRAWDDRFNLLGQPSGLSLE